jgi:hydrocephalus-inducing protein
MGTEAKDDEEVKFVF